MPNATPIVTPSLAKKIIDVKLVGNNMDNLDEGINPFSVVMIDNVNKTTEFDQTALKVARNYDDLVKGVSIPLQELNTLQRTKTSSTT
jgi:hypothetical protein